MRKTTIGLVMLLAACVSAGGDTRRQTRNVIANVLGPPPDVCEIQMGDNLDLCLIRHTPEGLLLEFGRPAYHAYFDLIGPGARVELWLRREDIGDLSRAQIWEPRRPLGEGELWGIGVGTDPPFVAVRLRGRIGTIEDVGYEG